MKCSALMMYLMWIVYMNGANQIKFRMNAIWATALRSLTFQDFQISFGFEGSREKVYEAKNTKKIDLMIYLAKKHHTSLASNAQRRSSSRIFSSKQRSLNKFKMSVRWLSIKTWQRCQCEENCIERLVSSSNFYHWSIIMRELKPMVS